MASRAFTIGMIRILRRYAPVRRRGRLPRQQQPDALRLEYYKALLLFVHQVTASFAAIKGDIIQALVNERRAQGKMDAPGRDDIHRAIDKAQRTADDDISKKRLEETAKRFGERVSSFQREQLDNQVKAALGVPLRLIEPATTAKLEGFAAENVSLIQGLTQRYFDRIRKDVNEAFESGMHPDTLAELFIERDGMAEDDARRIARDQIGKLNADFNEERQTELGITGYIWRTANDERVRDEHQELEGQSFKWDDPPAEGNPGEPIQCRCYAEPDFTPLLEG